MNNLKLRLVLLCLLGAIVIAGGVAGAGALQYRALLQQQSSRALATAQSVQKYFLVERAQQLETASNIVARNPSFAGYVAHAFGDESTPGGIDVASIRDLIGERREDLKADVVAILTPAGKVVAASGDIQSEWLDLSKNPILDRTKKTDDTLSGFLVRDKGLLLITCSTLRRGTDIQAMLLVGQRIDTRVITEAARLTNAGIALMQQTGTTWQVVTSTTTESVSQQLPAAMAHLNESGPDKPAVDTGAKLSTSDGIWVARATPLNTNDASVSLVSLLPPAFSAGLLQSIGVPLLSLGVALLALLIVFGVTSWLSMGRALSHLADLSARATKGDHALEFNMKGRGVVGRIGNGFNYLTRELSRYRVPTGTPMRRATDRSAR